MGGLSRSVLLPVRWLCYWWPAERSGNVENWTAERRAVQSWTISRREYERAMGQAALAQHRMAQDEALARKHVNEHGPTGVDLLGGEKFTVHCDSAGLFAIPREAAT